MTPPATTTAWAGVCHPCDTFDHSAHAATIAVADVATGEVHEARCVCPCALDARAAATLAFVTLSADPLEDWRP